MLRFNNKTSRRNRIVSFAGQQMDTEHVLPCRVSHGSEVLTTTASSR